MEGNAGVPLRFPRPSMAPVAAVLAVALVAAWIALGSAPALADQVRQSQWWLPALHILQAQQTSQGSGVTIAVLDTGVDAAAPDLAGSVLSGPDLSRSGRAASGPFYGIHGTEIASIIAGHGHGPGNTAGIIGVAPAAKILSIRVGLDSGDPMLANPAINRGLPAAIAAGIRYATNSGAAVIDLPLDPGAASATGTAGVPGLAVSSPAEQSAVAYALSKGVVLVAPAGDDGAGAAIVNYPAAYPGVISVGAFDRNFAKAPFSSRQPYVTMTAAGAGIAAESPTGYTSISSTSAASAVVAGIAALIRSAFPALTPAQVTKSLISSTRFQRPHGRQIGSGYGTVDAERALRAATAMAEPRGQGAFTGSAARVAPKTPAVHATRPTLRAKLERDAVISAGLLLILLIPAVVLALVRRLPALGEEPKSDGNGYDLNRRLANVGAGGAEQAEFLPSPAGAGRYGDSRGMDSLAAGERLAGPGASAFAGAGSYVAPRSFSGSSVGGITGSGGPADGGSRADAGGLAFPGPPPGQRGGRPGAGSPDRAPVLRGANGRAVVSGSPPWEPAAKPDSELPWATAPAPPAATPFGSAPPRPGRPGSLWDTAAAGGGAAPAEPVPPGAGRAADLGEDADPGSGPMSLWEQAESTESFPVVGEDDAG
jgi:hypothetical protein